MSTSFIVFFILFFAALFACAKTPAPHPAFPLRQRTALPLDVPLRFTSIRCRSPCRLMHSACSMWRLTIALPLAQPKAGSSLSPHFTGYTHAAHRRTTPVLSPSPRSVCDPRHPTSPASTFHRCHTLPSRLRRNEIGHIFTSAHIHDILLVYKYQRRCV